MKILVIGSGGREHALAWALARSPQVTQLYAATSNAGLLRQTIRADIDASDPNAVADFAGRARLDLVVVGPEQPLVDGVVDQLAARGIAAFGPTRAAARLEGSKVFAKEFMVRHHIPTARYRVVDHAAAAYAAVAGGEFGYPLVIKADGLAAGKGVIIAADAAAARRAIDDLLVARKLGAAGARLLIEECLTGRELSFLVLTDGWRACVLPLAQDHKRAFDGDRGPNTGGMGAFSTPGLLDAATEARILREIVEPTLAGARADGFPFTGVLYCGLMLTTAGPQVLEYNVRLGDPETQAILRRADGDWAELCFAAARGELSAAQPHWSDDAATCIVLASGGYPGNYEPGCVISGLDDAERIAGVVVFHAGTKLNEAGQTVTAGGRVLGVTARAATLAEATQRAYAAVNRIDFAGAHWRTDIGERL